jgi:hypothetical protein
MIGMKEHAIDYAHSPLKVNWLSLQIFSNKFVNRYYRFFFKYWLIKVLNCEIKNKNSEINISLNEIRM